jgi:peptidoglycan/LPS O-acetylase OafA/YrhL
MNLGVGIRALDGIRGLAVIAVICSHFPVLLGYRPTTPWARVNRLLSGGFLGVDVFFVLSGFLITSLLLKEHANSDRIDLKHFFARRALRLLPALYVLLIVDFVIAVLYNTSLEGQWNITWATVLYLNNWYFALPSLRHGPPDFQSNIGHLWSLSIEEQFYLVWPFVMLMFMRTRMLSKYLPAFLVAIITLVVLRRINLWNDGVPHLVVLIRTDARLDSLIIGALLALLFRYLKVDGRILRLAGYCAIPIFTFLAYQGADSAMIQTFGFTAVALAAMCMVYASAEKAWALNRLLEARWLTFTGRISYGLYLWHYVVFVVVNKSFAFESRLVMLTVGLLATWAVALLSWFFVERPFLRLKDRKYGHAAQG